MDKSAEVMLTISELDQLTTGLDVLNQQQGVTLAQSQLLLGLAGKLQSAKQGAASVPDMISQPKEDM